MENAKFVVVLLLLCGVAHAESDVRTLGDLDRLQSGRVYYDAQTAFNKSKMAAGQADIAPVTTQPVAGGEQVAPPVSSTLPELEKVAGQVATLTLPDGSSTMVRAGDSVQGGYSVVSVSLRGVVIRRTLDNRTFTLN